VSDTDSEFDGYKPKGKKNKPSSSAVAKQKSPEKKKETKRPSASDLFDSFMEGSDKSPPSLSERAAGGGE